jgi:hypothetical protein
MSQENVDVVKRRTPCSIEATGDDLALLSRRNGGVQALREAGATRLELATSGVTGRRSNQLSYAPSKGA